MGNNKKGHQPEAFARVLIDRALSDSEWDLLNPQQVQFEFHIPTGRADYLLKDSLDRVLWVLEANLALENPDKVEESIRGRTNAYKLIGERYIKVTYKEFSDEILIISVVDKGKGGQNEDRI